MPVFFLFKRLFVYWTSSLFFGNGFWFGCKVYDVHHTAPKGIVGGFVNEIAFAVQFPHAFVVGGFGANFADPHDFVPADADGVLKPVEVPELEEGDVEADVGWV